MASVYGSSLEAEEIDLSGLVESVVDSDEEDLAESMDVSWSYRTRQKVQLEILVKAISSLNKLILAIFNYCPLSLPVPLSR